MTRTATRSARLRPGRWQSPRAIDGYGRLASYATSGAATLARMRINGLDDRVSTVTAIGSTTDTSRFVYDMSGRLLGEYGVSASDVKAETIWLSPEVDAGGQPFGGDDGVGGYAPLAVVTGGAVYWVHGNHLGVPVVTTTASGALASPGGFTRVGFPGQTQTLALGPRNGQIGRSFDAVGLVRQPKNPFSLEKCRPGVSDPMQYSLYRELVLKCVRCCCMTGSASRRAGSKISNREGL